MGFTFTDSMEKMFEDVMNALFSCFPEDHIDYCFAELYPVDPVSFGEYILLEFVKYSYYESLEKTSLRTHIPYTVDQDDISERMRYQRAFKYTQKYKTLNYNLLAEQDGWDTEKMKEYADLLPTDMTKMENKLEGYKLSKMDIFEHDNIMNLRIIKSIVEQRILSSKKVSNNDFNRMFEEYDEWVKRLIDNSKKSDEDLLFNSMAFFTLEWKYSLEFIYMVADYMDKNCIEETDYLTLWALARPLEFTSRLGNKIKVDNRMVKERQSLIPQFITKGEADLKIQFYRQKYVEIVGLVALFNNLNDKEGGLYKEWFRKNTSIADWASFLKEYDVFSVWHKKEWTNRKIRLARKLLEQVNPFKLLGKNPDFRS